MANGLLLSIVDHKSETGQMVALFQYDYRRTP
jgi:hypothetical protein